jgi:hypothetical protein
MLDVNVGGAAGLWQCKVEEEDGLESEIEWYPDRSASATNVPQCGNPLRTMRRAILRRIQRLQYNPGQTNTSATFPALPQRQDVD